MNFNIDPYHLEVLKAQTLSVAGLKAITPEDCRKLSFSIMSRTNRGISEISLKRLFGFVSARFSPSVYTLDALANYCEYESWKAFCAVQSNDALRESKYASEILNVPLVEILLNSVIPTAVLKVYGPDFTILNYNSAYEDTTYTKGRDIKGLTLWDAFELDKNSASGSALLLDGMLKAVRTKQTVQMPPTQFNIPNSLLYIEQLNWWQVKFVPIVYDGIAKYLILITYNITDKILNQDAIEEAIMKELTMAEDLAKTNVRLTKAVESLAESYKELTDTKTQLEELNAHLEKRVNERTIRLVESEARQRELINNAPVAILRLTGPEHIIDTANKRVLQYWTRDSSVIGKPLVVALPEMNDQPFIDILNNVRESGIPYINSELRAQIAQNGVLEPRYFDMIYQPVQLIPGVTDSIYVVAVDITDHIIARKRSDESESMLRLAVTAAKIGVWSFSPRTRVLTYNSILTDILGWDGPEKLSYDEALSHVTPEFKGTLMDLVDSAIAEKTEYDFTYKQKRFNDGRIIWLRAIGKVGIDNSGEPCFSGIIRDITHETANLSDLRNGLDEQLEEPY